MTLRVVGAGLGRTGTMSLKLALEKLLGGPCYHMMEVFPRPEHVSMWHTAIRGEMPNWDVLFEGFVSAVDWPASAFWPQLADAYPKAPIVLSVRDADSWWKSANETIFEAAFRRFPGEADNPWLMMVTDLFETTFTKGFLEEDKAKAAFERHNDDVRRTAPPDRLLEWEIGAGWEPICDVLGLPVPDEPFPHANTTEEFRTRAGWE